MLSLTDCASIALDPDLRALIGLHTGKVFIVQGGDTPEVINAALGFAITGEQAEEPSFLSIEDHGLWFEITYADMRIFVENGPGTELGIHYMCLAHIGGA